ncbi:hypothetical protein M0812_08789 [Anaeramoeba flamelloides]|uniref:BTB domain-containing protein n=1 Tax=Anaeramoeba flamelloides TaxID=1746091 RepID=A0AAV8A0K7_9EUKA|nr:hypothetical protein M0812_08789 [Anaeramoeba flamelloides]
MESNVWFFGQLSNFNQVKTGTPTPQLTKIKGDIVSMNGCNNNIIYYTTNNCSYSTGKNTYEKSLFAENDRIRKVSSGFCHNLILSESGRVFKTNSEKSNPKEYTEIVKLGSKCVDVLGGEFFSIFLLENGDLYCKAENLRSQISPNKQIIKKKRESDPNSILDKVELISENVLTLGEGNAARHLLYLTDDYTLWSSGSNNFGQIGSDNFNQRTEKEITIPEQDNRNIQQMYSGFEMNLILYQDNALFIAGSEKSSNNPKTKGKFLRITFFNERPIKKISCGSYHTLILTQDNQVYFIGGISQIYFNITKEPLLLKLDNYDHAQNLSIGCGVKFGLIHTVNDSLLYKDFYNFYKDQQFTDYKIKNLMVHRSLLEFRLNTKIETIKQILNNYSNKEIDAFLVWVYSDKFSLDHNLLYQICNKFNIESPRKKTLKHDLLALYKNEDSKDFSLLVKDFEDNEDQNDEDVDEQVDEDNYEEIPVHKFVLLARSGLFREMFQNLNEKEKDIQKIKDYSQKSIESLEIFIQYLYTDKIELTADDDPELIFEELSDAAEYYQLSNPFNFLNHLKLINK